VTKHLRRTNSQKKRFILAHGFSPWLAGSIVFGPVVNQEIMVEGRETGREREKEEGLGENGGLGGRGERKGKKEEGLEIQNTIVWLRANILACLGSRERSIQCCNTENKASYRVFV
jgi:hypothetical protein